MRNLWNVICHFNIGLYVKEFFDELSVNSPSHRMDYNLFMLFLKEQFRLDDPDRKMTVYVKEKNGINTKFVVKGNIITATRE